MAAAPGIDRQLFPMGSGEMLFYGLMPYRPKSAKETTMWPLIMRANQKRHLSCGKSCIRFTSLDKVDAAALPALVHDTVASTAEGRNAYSANYEDDQLRDRRRRWWAAIRTGALTDPYPS